MTSGDIGTPIVVNTGLTGDPSRDYNIPPAATTKLFLAPVTNPPSVPVGYVLSVNANKISATYYTTGGEFSGSNGGFYYVQLRVIGPNNSYVYQSPVDRKYINPGFPS